MSRLYQSAGTRFNAPREGSGPAPGNSGPMSANLDEWLERRELELGRQRDQVGREAARAHTRLRSLLARVLPWAAGRWRRTGGQRSLLLVEALGRLSEVREVRRGLLGLSPNALIRSRATPNFVADNPDYARKVAEDGEEP